MSRYELDVTEEAIARYIVTADSEEDAKAKLRARHKRVKQALRTLVAFI